MKTSKFFYALAATTLLGLSACSSEEPVAQNGDGNVNFTVTLPDAIGTRAYSDGLSATHLDYYVYDEDNRSTNIAALNGTATFTDRKATVSLNLVSGKSYSIVFLATSDSQNYYTYTASTKELEVTYSSAAQDEKRDAFYVYEPTFKVTGAINKNVVLKRPFAQINVGTTDWADAKKAGISLTETSMTVTGVANKINLGTGVVYGNEEVTFTSAAMPGDTETFPYAAAGVDRYMAMNYILVGADKTTVDVKLKTNATPTIDEMVFSQVPVQRNYRTNIYGALLTNPVDFNIIIDPIYYEDDLEYTVVNSNEDLTNAIAAGESNIRLDEGDYTLNYPSTASADLKIVGAGKDKTTLSINKSFYTNGKNISFAGLTYKVPTGLTYNESNFGFIQRAGDVSFFNCKIVGGLRLNLSDGEVATIDNCEFEVNTQSGFDGYPLFYYAATGSKVVVSNSTFKSKGKGIIMYCESAQEYDLTVNNCTFEASETIDKCAIQMHTEWGISGTLNINNCTATGFQDKNDGLWYEVNNNSKAQTNTFKVIVNGVTVQQGK